jgi:oligosaccharide repeat unit polymerase
MSLSVLTHSKRRELPPSPAAADNTLDQAFWVGLGMSIASGILLAYAVAVMGNLLQYERADMYRSTGSDIRGLGVFIMTFPAAITLLVIGARKRWITGMTLAIAAISFLILLLVGDRSIAMTPVLVGAILWVKTGRRISPPLASGALAFVLVVIPAIGLLRQEGPYSDISRKEIEQSLEETKFFQSFAIMGQSGGVLGHILRLVPEKYPHRYGSSYAKALASAIPNIETDISKGTRQALKHRSRIGSAPLDELAPDKWLSHELLGRDRVRRGHGVGFSAIGEAYLNFGYPGVVGVFVIFGFLLGKMDLRNVLMHPKLLIFAAAMFPHFVFTTRNQFSTFIKPAAFLLIIIVLWHFGTWWFRPGKKSGSESPEPPEADPINLLETTRG